MDKRGKIVARLWKKDIKEKNVYGKRFACTINVKQFVLRFVTMKELGILALKAHGQDERILFGLHLFLRNVLKSSKMVNAYFCPDKSGQKPTLRL